MNGDRLLRLHRYNGWNALFLLVSGIILYVPAFRGPLGPARVALKYIHILSGLGSLGLLLAYLPLAPEHWRRLARRAGQKANAVLIVGLLLGWGLTGIALWMNRYLPDGWAQTALIWHDRLTWFALPWAAAHSLTRYLKLRLLPVTAPVEDRRVFLAGAAAFVGALLWGDFGRLLGLPGFESAESDTPNSHAPVPPEAQFVPPAISSPPAGGGGRGRFRAYTVVSENPKFDPATWDLTIGGLVEQTLRFSWEEFIALPRTVQVSDFHCVTGWSVYHVTWEGVRVADLLDRAGVSDVAKYVKFYSGDGVYDDSLPLSVARSSDVMLAYIMDASALPTPLGGPVRLVVPQMYGYKSVKWVRSIELTPAADAGYWEQRGYPADAWLGWSQGAEEG